MKTKISLLEKAILADPRRKWKINDLAQIMNLTPAHLHKLLKDEIKTSPIQFIKRQHLEKARELLLNGFRQVKQIRFEVGMPDPSYFSREFRKKYGLPPNQYREKNFGKLDAEG